MDESPRKPRLFPDPYTRSIEIRKVASPRNLGREIDAYREKYKKRTNLINSNSSTENQHEKMVKENWRERSPHKKIASSTENSSQANGPKVIELHRQQNNAKYTANEKSSQRATASNLLTSRRKLQISKTVTKKNSLLGLEKASFKFNDFVGNIAKTCSYNNQPPAPATPSSSCGATYKADIQALISNTAAEPTTISERYNLPLLAIWSAPRSRLRSTVVVYRETKQEHAEVNQLAIATTEGTSAYPAELLNANTTGEIEGLESKAPYDAWTGRKTQSPTTSTFQSLYTSTITTTTTTSCTSSSIMSAAEPLVDNDDDSTPSTSSSASIQNDIRSQSYSCGSGHNTATRESGTAHTGYEYICIHCLRSQTIDTPMIEVLHAPSTTLIAASFSELSSGFVSNADDDTPSTSCSACLKKSDKSVISLNSQASQTTAEEVESVIDHTVVSEDKFLSLLKKFVAAIGSPITDILNSTMFTIDDIEFLERCFADEGIDLVSDSNFVDNASVQPSMEGILLDNDDDKPSTSKHTAKVENFSKPSSSSDACAIVDSSCWQKNFHTYDQNSASITTSFNNKIYLSSYFNTSSFIKEKVGRNFLGLSDLWKIIKNMLNLNYIRHIASKPISELTRKRDFTTIFDQVPREMFEDIEKVHSACIFTDTCILTAMKAGKFGKLNTFPISIYTLNMQSLCEMIIEKNFNSHNDNLAKSWHHSGKNDSENEMTDAEDEYFSSSDHSNDSTDAL